eukprot:Gb_37656 [translate_table: standard]
MAGLYSICTKLPIPEQVFAQMLLHKLRTLRSKFSMSIKHTKKVIIWVSPKFGMNAETILVCLIKCFWVVTSLRKI